MAAPLIPQAYVYCPKPGSGKGGAIPGREADLEAEILGGCTQTGETAEDTIHHCASSVRCCNEDPVTGQKVCSEGRVIFFLPEPTVEVGLIAGLLLFAAAAWIRRR